MAFATVSSTAESSRACRPWRVRGSTMWAPGDPSQPAVLLVTRTLPRSTWSVASPGLSLSSMLLPAVSAITVRHGSRSADIPFDWDDPQIWPAVLAGVTKVYLTYYPDLAVPGSVDAISRLTELAEDAGVSRLVLLSGRNEAEAEKAERVVM